jgi:hypothetical protein
VRGKSPALQRFLASMVLDFDKWHDGEPYDLDALRQIEPSERAEVLALLDAHLAGSGADWRDVEAVAALDTEEAAALLAQCAHHRSAEIRLHAAPFLAERGAPDVPERELLRILGDPRTDAPIVATLRLATAYPTERVKQALLECAVHGAQHLRVHAAALALYLAGVADDEFDWNHRALFLRFGVANEHERAEALRELRALMGNR